MLPINPAHRRLIRKYIPQITEKELENYDHYAAFLHHKQLELTKKGISESADKRKPKLPSIESMQQLQQKFDHNQKYVQAAQKLWVARQDYVLKAKNLFHSPSIEKIVYIAVTYHLTKLKLLGYLWYNKFIRRFIS